MTDSAPLDGITMLDPKIMATTVDVMIKLMQSAVSLPLGPYVTTTEFLIEEGAYSNYELQLSGLNSMATHLQRAVNEYQKLVVLGEIRRQKKQKEWMRDLREYDFTSDDWRKGEDAP